MSSAPPPNSAPPPSSRTQPNRAHPLAQLLLAACALFILTVLLMVAAALNRQAAVLAQFFDKHGMELLATEVGAILVLSLVALAVERRQTSRRLKARKDDLLEDVANFASSHRRQETPEVRDDST